MSIFGLAMRLPANLKVNNFCLKQAFSSRSTDGGNFGHKLSNNRGVYRPPESNKNEKSFANKMEGTNKQLKVVITGFSRFACRDDLLDVLGPIKPASIDVMLDTKSLLPTGNYFLWLTMAGNLDVLRKHLNLTWNDKYSAIIYMFDPRSTVLASSLNITNCTVKVSTKREGINQDELFLMFENYALRKTRSIELIPRTDGIYLVTFQSPDEAERAVVEMSTKQGEVEVIQLYHYSC
jgi:hypothetical protein